MAFCTQSMPAMVLRPSRCLLSPLELMWRQDLGRLFTALPVLKELVLDSASPATVVLSSTWRRGLVSSGGSMVVDPACASRTRRLKCARLCGALPVASKTPSHPEGSRPVEIGAWVERFSPRAWVAVDDEGSNLVGIPEPNAVHTDAATGLTREKATEIAAKLSRQLPTRERYAQVGPAQ